MSGGISLVISAPSGTGKSTLVKKLLSEFPNLGFSVSCATRAKRAGEVEGEDYFFISRGEFEARVAKGEFAEWAEVHGNFYGTPLKPVIERLNAGKDILFDVDVQGARQIRNALPESRFVFILPPSMRELETRLRRRGQEGEEVIRRRLRNAGKEMREAVWYDAILVNDNLDAAYDRLRAVYIAAGLAPARNAAFLDRLLLESGERGAPWPD